MKQSDLSAIIAMFTNLMLLQRCGRHYSCLSICTSIVLNAPKLMFAMQLNLNVTLPFARQRRGGGQGDYLLSFLDDTMLVGRAQNGTFVFVRDS